MIDLHTHVLCGVDDGAKSMEITRKMLSRCREEGILTVAATSHNEQCDDESYERTFAEVSGIASEYGIRLHPGIEYLYGDLLETAPEKLRTIARSKYLLLDLRRVYPDDSVCRNIYKITARGFQVLLAHPERLWPNGSCLQTVRRLTENPSVVCQINAGSILGTYGKSPFKCAWQLLEAGLCAIIASDAHSDQKLNLTRCREKLLRIYPEDLVSSWLEKNPKRIISGEMLMLPKPDQALWARIKRAWKYRF